MDVNAVEHDEPESITICLRQVHERIPGAEERLFDLVYNQLRKMAGHKMRGERPNHTFQATALANETYMRLIRAIRNTPWKDRAHFYSTCALTMRHILIDHARKGKIEQVDIELVPGVAITRQRSEWLMSFDESLSRLAGLDPRGAKIVEMTYFVGLNRKDVADLLQISTKTVHRDLETCMRWISRNMGAANS